MMSQQSKYEEFNIPLSGLERPPNPIIIRSPKLKIVAFKEGKAEKEPARLTSPSSKHFQSIREKRVEQKN